MQNIRIWHNENCSKSRLALDFLKNNDCSIEVIDYLQKDLTINDLKEVLELLNIKAHDLFRVSEELYKQLALKSSDDEEFLIQNSY